jgi:hypothetical protein
VMRAVRDFVVEHLAGDGLTVLVLDESGQEKAGCATAGVKRQYVGCAGKVANAVNFVNATYSTPAGHALVGSRLYVPAEQLADPATRTRMGIPADMRCATKPELGLALLAECVNASVRVPWCTADAVYGRDPSCAAAANDRASATCSACRAPWLPAAPSSTSRWRWPACSDSGPASAPRPRPRRCRALAAQPDSVLTVICE